MEFQGARGCVSSLRMQKTETKSRATMEPLQCGEKVDIDIHGMEAHTKMQQHCPPKPSCEDPCPPPVPECEKPKPDPCEKPKDPCCNSGSAGGGVAALLVWFFIIFIVIWLVLFAIKPECLCTGKKNELDTGKTVLAAFVIALVIIIIIWVIKAFAYRA